MFHKRDVRGAVPYECLRSRLHCAKMREDAILPYGFAETFCTAVTFFCRLHTMLSRAASAPERSILMNNNNSCLCNLFDNNCTWIIVIALIILLFHCNGNGCGCGNF